MNLQDAESWEIIPFFDSLGNEKELVMMTAEAALAGDFIAGVRVDKKLAGITGIRRLWKFVPNLYIVVNAKYQGMHLGNTLMGENLSFARRNYHFLTLSTYKREEYKPALSLYDKYGFKYLCWHRDHYWMYIAFDKKGALVCKALPFLIPVFHYLSILLSFFSWTFIKKGYQKLFSH